MVLGREVWAPRSNKTGWQNIAIVLCDKSSIIVHCEKDGPTHFVRCCTIKLCYCTI